MNKSGFQIFIEHTILSALSILKVSLLSSFRVKIPKKTTHNECVILGNGPSLKNFLQYDHAFVQDKSVVCVNFFSRTDEYTRIKPTYYILTSPEYFTNEKKESWKAIRQKTFDAMEKTTSWPMYLMVPALARRHKEWKKTLTKNPNITIVYFNNTPIEGFRVLNHFFYRRNLGMPRPHNVLIPSILLGINLGFRTIYLTGSDHNWTKELFVTDQNEVLLSQKHFYDQQLKPEDKEKNTPLPRPMYKGGSIEKRKLHEVLIKFFYAFRSYWDLGTYAESKGVKIYNLTPGSFIDAFERLKLPDTLKNGTNEKRSAKTAP